MSTEYAKTEDCIDVPAGAAAIGVDAEGAIHWLGSRVTNDGLPVFVEESDGEIDVYDLAETPCWDAEDPVKAWIHHVQDKRGDWESVTYDASLTTLLATSMEGQR